MTSRSLANAPSSWLLFGAVSVFSACGGASGADDPSDTEPDGATPAGTDVSGGSSAAGDSQQRPELPFTALASEPLEVAADFPGCLSGTATSFAGKPAAHQYTLWTYDASSRVLAAIPSDEAGNSLDSPEPSESRAKYWRLDASGRVVVQARGERVTPEVGGVSRYTVSRQRFERDTNGNAVAIHTDRLDWVDLSGDIVGRDVDVTELANDYDAQGRLIRHRVAASESGEEYGYDAQGRCETVTGIGARLDVERRDYDELGRLWHRYRTERTDTPQSPDVTVTYRYDAEARLLSETIVNEGSSSSAGFTRSYRRDGNITETRRAPFIDIPVGPTLRIWSAGCNELRAEIPRTPTQECTAEHAQPGDGELLLL
jgi:YD repeat-containing protein